MKLVYKVGPEGQIYDSQKNLPDVALVIDLTPGSYTLEVEALPKINTRSSLPTFESKTPISEGLADLNKDKSSAPSSTKLADKSPIESSPMPTSKAAPLDFTPDVPLQDFTPESSPFKADLVADHKSSTGEASLNPESLLSNLHPLAPATFFPGVQQQIIETTEFTEEVKAESISTSISGKTTKITNNYLTPISSPLSEAKVPSAQPPAISEALEELNTEQSASNPSTSGTRTHQDSTDDYVQMLREKIDLSWKQIEEAERCVRKFELKRDSCNVQMTAQELLGEQNLIEALAQWQDTNGILGLTEQTD